MSDRPTAYQLARAIHQEHGIPVFPVALSQTETGKWRKMPLVKWSQVSGDPREVIWRGANAIGVPTGQRSGLYVIDLDDYKPGSESADWLADHKLPETRVHRTASGGRHMIYRLPSGIQLGNRASVVPGLDTRGNGGMFVWGDTDGHYSVLNGRAASELPRDVCEELKGDKDNDDGPVLDTAIPALGYVDMIGLRQKLTSAFNRRSGGSLRDRFEGSVADLTDSSASGRDMSLAGLLAHRSFGFDEITLILLTQFPHGVAARDGWDDRTERLAKRCAYRAIQNKLRRTELRQQAMERRLAELRASFPRQAGATSEIDP
ncbi:bifunctional DNA primase/polymerase [Vannielia litorea]|uniref:bifunctional DNA primase/polymerase n=1 Tax=Vannielia litorea TaxID=1217970 RepID=UPI001BCBF5A2|nr:bifunctional DNA primase/polymerase [Vannielia litorea]